MKVCVIGERESPGTLNIFESLRDIGKFESVFFVPTNKVKIGIKNGREVVLHKNKNLAEFDAVIPRFTRQNIFFEYSIVKSLAASTYLPISPNTVLCAGDKYLTLEILNNSKIPTPETFLTLSPDSGKRIAREMNAPLVLKLPGGEGGKGIVFAEQENAVAIIDTLNVLHQPIFIQKYVKSVDGSIEKAIVLGDDVAVSLREISRSDDKRTNVPFGKLAMTALDKKTKKLAIRAARAVEAEICEVDIIKENGKSFVLDVNITPDTKTLGNIAGVDLSRQIGEFVAKRTELSVAEKFIGLGALVGKGIIGIPKRVGELIAHHPPKK